MGRVLLYLSFVLISHLSSPPFSVASVALSPPHSVNGCGTLQVGVVNGCGHTCIVTAVPTGGPLITFLITGPGLSISPTILCTCY